MTDARRITELFTTGREIVLDPGDPPVLIWIEKLNSFQRGEAQRDGAAGRARLLTQLTEADDEIILMRKRLGQLEPKELIDRMVVLRRDEILTGATKDVQADPEWKDNLILLQRMDMLQKEGSTPFTQEEQDQYNKINEDYFTVVQGFMSEREQGIRQELSGVATPGLVDLVIERYRETRAVPAFMADFNITNFWLATRSCDGVKLEDGTFDHGKCKHNRLWLDRAEVRNQPDRLLKMIELEINRLEMTPEEAGNSDAPGTSSKS